MSGVAGASRYVDWCETFPETSGLDRQSLSWWRARTFWATTTLVINT